MLDVLAPKGHPRPTVNYADFDADVDRRLEGRAKILHDHANDLFIEAERRGYSARPVNVPGLGHGVVLRSPNDPGIEMTIYSKWAASGPYYQWVSHLGRIADHVEGVFSFTAPYLRHG